MVAAIMNGLLGIGTSLAIGIHYLGMSIEDILLCILVSNFAALVSLLATLKAEKNPWLVKVWLNRTLKTWFFLAVIYFGIQFTLCPPLRSSDPFLYLTFPLMFSTGFAMVIFGPIQDEFIKRQQKRAREARSTLRRETQSNSL